MRALRDDKPVGGKAGGPPPPPLPKPEGLPKPKPTDGKVSSIPAKPKSQSGGGGMPAFDPSKVTLKRTGKQDGERAAEIPAATGDGDTFAHQALNVKLRPVNRERRVSGASELTPSSVLSRWSAPRVRAQEQRAGQTQQVKEIPLFIKDRLDKDIPWLQKLREKHRSNEVPSQKNNYGVGDIVNIENYYQLSFRQADMAQERSMNEEGLLQSFEDVYGKIHQLNDSMVEYNVPQLHQFPEFKELTIDPTLSTAQKINIYRDWFDKYLGLRSSK